MVDLNFPAYYLPFWHETPDEAIRVYRDFYRLVALF